MLFRKVCLLLLSQCFCLLAFAQSPSMEKSYVFEETEYLPDFGVLHNGNTIVYSTDRKGRPLIKEFGPSGALVGESVVKGIEPTSKRNKISGYFRMNGRFFYCFS